MLIPQALASPQRPPQKAHDGRTLRRPSSSLAAAAVAAGPVLRPTQARKQKKAKRSQRRSDGPAPSVAQLPTACSSSRPSGLLSAAVQWLTCGPRPPEPEEEEEEEADDLQVAHHPIAVNYNLEAGPNG